jgi:hypothetical protein
MMGLKDEAEMIGEGDQTEEVFTIEGPVALSLIAGVVEIGEARLVDNRHRLLP